MESFEDYNKRRRKKYQTTAADNPWRTMDVVCPKCEAHIEQLMGVVLTSLPPKRQARCAKKCGWTGYVIA